MITASVVKELEINLHVPAEDLCHLNATAKTEIL